MRVLTKKVLHPSVFESALNKLTAHFAAPRDHLDAKRAQLITAQEIANLKVAIMAGDDDAPVHVRQ